MKTPERTRILLTGATGFIGRHILHRLLQEGMNLLCLTRRKINRQKENAIWVTTDYSESHLKKIFKNFKPQFIIHLAAYGVNPSHIHPEKMVKGNVEITMKLLKACADQPPELFVMAGSCSEYAPVKKGVKIREDHPLLPNTPYGAAKASSFLIARAFARRWGVPFINLRLFNVFGPGEKSYRLIPYVVKKVINGEPAKLTQGEQVRDFIYVEDVADAFYCVLSKCSKLEPFTAYNVCRGKPVSVKELGIIVKSILNAPDELMRWGDLPYREGESMWIVGEPGKLKKATGWEAKTSLEVGVRKTVEHFSRKFLKGRRR